MCGMNNSNDKTKTEEGMQEGKREAKKYGTPIISGSC